MRKSFNFIYLMFFLLVGNLCFAKDVNGVVAIVGDRIITSMDIDVLSNIMAIQGRIPATEIKKDTVRQDILRHAIDRYLFLDYAGNFNVNTPEKEDLFVNFAAGLKMDKAQISDKLHSVGLGDADIEEYLYQEFIIMNTQQNYVSSKAGITDESAQQYTNNYMYENTKYHIIDFYLPKSDEKISTQKFDNMVNDAVIDYKSGQDVSRPMYANDLGVRNLSQLPSLYANVIVNLKPNEPSYMVIAGNGYHSLLLLEKQQPAEPTLTESKKRLFAEKFNEFIPALLQELHDSTYIKVNSN